MMCACGKPLHYRDPQIRRLVETMIAKYGQDVLVVTSHGTFRVPRHYIALHGLKGKEVHKLGFPREDENESEDAV